jgi:hypothetical protein
MGASTLKKGTTQIRLVQGRGARSSIEILRNPLVFKKNALLDRTGSQ